MLNAEKEPHHHSKQLYLVCTGCQPLNWYWPKTHLPMMKVESWYDTWQWLLLASGRFGPEVTLPSGSSNSVDANRPYGSYPPVSQR